MNTAYKHLDAKLRIAELTIAQWIGVLLGVGIGVVWGVYLSPFGTRLTLVTSIYLGAIPAGAALLANLTEFNLWLLVRSAMAWRRLEGRFMGGPGETAHGYALHEDAHERELRKRRREAPELDLASLWKEDG